MYKIIIVILFTINSSLASQSSITGKGDCLTTEFRDIRVRDALQIYADFKKVNIVMDVEIQGSVDLTLHCVKSEIIIESILSMFDLTIIEKENLMLVSERNKLTKTTKLQKLVKLFHLDSEDIEDIFKKESKSMTVTSIESSNSIYLEGSHADVNRATDTILMLDVPKKQYVISVELISTSSDFSRTIGTTIQARLENDDLITDAFSTASALATGGMSIVYDKFSSALLRAEISAEEIKGNSKLISSPRLVAYENNEAEINQGVLIPYQVQQDDGAFTTEFNEASLSVKVTPRPAHGDNVYLDIFVSKDAPGLQTAQGVQIETRQITTQVRLKEGSTIMLGGIHEDTITESSQGIPVLRDIPYIGWLFGNSEEKKTNQELIILITPKNLIS